MTADSLFKWRHFLPEIILLNVRWYCCYSLSYRDLEEMMAERGASLDKRHQRRRKVGEVIQR
jgi:transposase, IS6 family